MRLWFLLMAALCLGLSQAGAAAANGFPHGEVDSPFLGFRISIADTVDSGSIMTPEVTIRLYGLEPPIGMAWFRIEDAYADSLGPLDFHGMVGEEDVVFRPFRVNLSVGWHVAACTLFDAPPDTGIWGMTRLFYVRAPTAIAEPQPPAARPAGCASPTIVRNSVTIPGTRTPGPKSRSAILDLSGRKVLALKPGPNDVSRLAPGVYFVRERTSAPGHQPSAVCKVILTR